MCCTKKRHKCKPTCSRSQPYTPNALLAHAESVPATYSKLFQYDSLVQARGSLS